MIFKFHILKWTYTLSSRKKPTLLYKVGFNRIEVNGNHIDLHNTDIDFGSIAKGYAADKMVKYLKDKGAKNGIVNLGGNVAVFGKEYKVGIKKPFSDNEIAAELLIKNLSVTTAGNYERCFTKDGKLYQQHRGVLPRTKCFVNFRNGHRAYLVPR